MTVTRGKRHDYLGMTLVFMSEGKLKIDMIDYIDKICREFPEELVGDTKYPWSEKLFAVDKNSDVLNTEKEFFSYTYHESHVPREKGKSECITGGNKIEKR